MYQGGSAFSYQPSISDSITSTGPVSENAANQRSAARRDSHVSSFFYINCVENLTGLAKARPRKSTREGEKRIKRRYTTARVDRNREVETRSRQLYSISPALSLVFARKSIFVTADWARLDSRGWNESEMNEGWWEKKRVKWQKERERERAKDGDKTCQLAWVRIITFTSGRRSVCAGGLIKFARLIRLFVDYNVRFGN